MAIVDEIDDLKKRRISELRTAFEFRGYTNFSYHLFNESVGKGSKSIIELDGHKSRINQDALKGKFIFYNKNYITPLVLQKMVSIFEAFFFDLIKLLFINQPEYLNKSKKFEVRDALTSYSGPQK